MAITDVVVVAVEVTKVLLHCGFLVVSMWRHARNDDCLGLGARIRAWLRGDTDDHDDGQQHVQNDQQHALGEKLAEIRLASLLESLESGRNLVAAYAVVFLVRRVLGLPRHTEHLFASFHLLSYITASVFCLRPSLAHKLGLFVLHSWIMSVVFVSCIWLGLSDATLFTHFFPIVLILRVRLVIAYPVVGVNLCWNFAWGILTTIVSLTDDAPCGLQSLFSILGREAMVLYFLSGVVGNLEATQTSQVCSDLQATGYLGAKRMMDRLLADMCDAVVELNHNLSIRQSCPKLAGLLLRGTGGNALKDEEFASLAFNEEERGRFRDFVARRAVPMEHDQNYDGDRLGASMYMTLKDADGTPVPMQLFHSCHVDRPGEVCHIVGVFEIEDSGRPRRVAEPVGQDIIAEPVGQDVQVNDPLPDALPVASVIGARHSEDERESAASVPKARAPTDTSDASICLVPLIPEKLFTAAPALAFDGVTFNVVACTITFRSVTGPIPMNTNLKDIILDFTDFAAWVQSEVRGLPLGQDPTSFDLTIRPYSVGSKHANLKFSATAWIFEAWQDITASEIGVQDSRVGEPERFELLVVMVVNGMEPKSTSNKPPKHRAETRVGVAQGLREYVL